MTAINQLDIITMFLPSPFRWWPSRSIILRTPMEINNSELLPPLPPGAHHRHCRRRVVTRFNASTWPRAHDAHATQNRRMCVCCHHIRVEYYCTRMHHVWMRRAGVINKCPNHSSDNDSRASINRWGARYPRTCTSQPFVLWLPEYRTNDAHHRVCVYTCLSLCVHWSGEVIFVCIVLVVIDDAVAAAAAAARTPLSECVSRFVWTLYCGLWTAGIFVWLLGE